MVDNRDRWIQVCGFVLFGVVMFAICGVPGNRPKRNPPTWQGAGEVAGEKATKFSRGFAKGVWETATGKRK